MQSQDDHINLRWSSDSSPYADSRCLGTNQQLKSKFSSGYSLELKMAATADESLDSDIRQLFPSAVNLERFADHSVYKISKSDVKSLGEAFAKLERGMR